MVDEIERIRNLGYSLSSAVDIYLEFMREYDDAGLVELECWLLEQEKEIEKEKQYV